MSEFWLKYGWYRLGIYIKTCCAGRYEMKKNNDYRKGKKAGRGEALPYVKAHY
jgi:hypothetical protein